MTAPILLSPGPVNVSPRVRAAQAGGDVCHREPEFRTLLGAVRRKLVEAFAPGGSWEAVVLSGSGTLALEAAVTSCLDERGKLLVIENGVYGERIAHIARAYGLPLAEIVGDWLKPPGMEAVAAALARDGEIRVVAMVHHETTTGLLNPVAEVGDLVRRHGRRLLVDSISGLGGEVADLDAWGVDLCVGTANKCIQGVPGVAFVLVRRVEAERLARFPRRSFALHLPLHLAAQRGGTVPFTPAVPACFALDAALDELLEETVAGRCARYAAAAALLREGFAARGFHFLLPAAWRSNSITSLRLPADVSYGRLHDALRARGFVIYAGQGRLEAEIFRVANMGHLTLADFRRFLDALDPALAEARDSARPRRPA